MTSVRPIDQHYTPKALARELIGAVTLDRVGMVGDFAAGDGELLRAAQERWPNAALVATDIDPPTVAGLQKSHPGWSTSRCDFTNPRSRARTLALRGAVASFDVIALNPPFSFRGGAKREVQIGDKVVSCSPPLAFLIDALAYLREGGQLVAILPHGTLSSEKDRSARLLLTESFGFDVVQTCARGAFASCTPRTAIVRLGTDVVSQDWLPILVEPIRDVDTRVGDVSLKRGRVPVGDSQPEGLPLAHTTELRGGELLQPRRFADSKSELVRGPAVLIPRIGKPSKTKVVVMKSRRAHVVLSDCVLAVECSTLAAAQIVQKALLMNWAVVEAMYGGTCARYLTLASLRDLLAQLGVGVLPYGLSVRSRIGGRAGYSGDGGASIPVSVVSQEAVEVVY